VTKIGDGKGNATTLRLQLLTNGYTPLPNLNKICIYPNWPNIKVDEKFLRARGRDKKYTATGLRLDAGLTAIDNDSDDQQLVDAFADRALAAELELRHALFRNSRPPREMWLCRTTEPLAGTVRSQRWLKPGEAKTKPRLMDQAMWDLLSDEEREVQGKPKIHCLEVLSGSGRQVGAFGPHSHNPDGTVKYSYGWEDDISPATTPLAELPALSPPALGHLCELFDDCARALGFVELPIKARPHGSVLYTLTPDMEIETLLDGIMTIEAARDWADSTYDSEHRCSWSFDEPSHDNPTHCSVRYTKAHGLEIHVHGEGLTYREADRKPPDVAELGAVLANVQPETASSDEPGPSDELEPGPKPMSSIVTDPNDSSVGYYNAVAWLQEHYAYWMGGFHGRGAVLRVFVEDGKADPLTVPALKLRMKRYELVTVNDRGTIKRTSPVDLWLTLPTCIAVAGTRMAPAEPWPLYGAGDDLMVNTYRKPRHTRLAGSLAAWDAFLARLIPDATERAWFEQWTAYKWHHPEVPMVAVLMVALHQGTGRGTLFSIIRLLFGSHLCVTVDFGSRTGSRSGSEFNEREAHALFVFVNEAVEEEGHKYGRRNTAYDMLKERLDPSGTEQRMYMAKGQMPFWCEPAASTIIASNHGNAVRLPKDDRRIAVILNPDEKMTIAERDEIRAWMAEPANIAELARRLEAAVHDKAAFDPYDAPTFQGKLDMIDLAVTDIEDAWAQAKVLMPAELFTMTQALTMVQTLQPAAATADYAQKVRWHIAANSFRLREKGEPGERFRYRGRREVVYAKTDKARPRWLKRGHDELVKELDRNADEAKARTTLHVVPSASPEK
jgi:hypothetical protein